MKEFMHIVVLTTANLVEMLSSWSSMEIFQPFLFMLISLSSRVIMFCMEPSVK